MKNILLGFGVLLLVLTTPVFAELPENVRNSLPDLMEAYCHNSVEYDLDKPLGVWDKETKKWNEGSQVARFHKTMGCVLDSALEEITKHSKRVAEEVYGSDLPVDVFVAGGDCGSIRLETVQATQQAKGFESLCGKSEVAEISQIFSSCQVAETLLNEWCGYDMFLYAKMMDEQSFRDLDGDLGFAVGERTLQFQPFWERVAKERRDAEVTVMDALDWYQKTEQAVRQDSWLIAIREQLRAVQEEWAKIRSALGKFKDKFINASATL